MIAKIIEVDNKVLLHHIKGGGTYTLFDETNIEFVRYAKGKYVDITLMNGDRYGLTTKAKINYYLTDDASAKFVSEYRESKLDKIL